MVVSRASNVVHVEPEFCPAAIEEWISTSRERKKIEKGIQQSDFTMKAKKHLSALGWVFWYARKGQRQELRYVSPEGKCFYSLVTACKSCLESHTEKVGKLGFLPPQESFVSAGWDKGSPISTLTEVADSPDLRTRPGGRKISSESKKRKRKEAKLDGDDVVIGGGTQKSRSKTRKPNDKKEKSSRMQSKRTEEDAECAVKPGIGKSLAKLLKLRDVKKKTNKQPLRSSRRAHSTSHSSITNDMNDDICSVCHYGGQLVLCDACPSAFHEKCLGLTGFPEEELWFCPSCCCGICGHGESKDDGFMICEQCQSRFHVGCLKQEIVVSCKGWFCSIKCERVFSSLQDLAAKEIRVSDNNLVWRLLKPPEDDGCNDDTDVDLNSKLHRAVHVMHECFEPSKDPFTGKDLVEDMIFGRKSVLKRVNFHGFYTVVLERKNKLITVAAVRVFRDVVEIPLVATAPKHRKLGMCRTLMNELERQMAQIGVYRLVLPAVTSLASTWTERFGFSVMEGSERIKLLNHSFLDFQDTVMCHKVLMKRPDSARSALIDEDLT